MAGWIGGSAGIVVGHPADTVKVVQQVFAMKECMPAELSVEDTWCIGVFGFPYSPQLGAKSRIHT